MGLLLRARCWAPPSAVIDVDVQELWHPALKNPGNLATFTAMCRALATGQPFAAPNATAAAAPFGIAAAIPILRLDGLDSQSCFECHMSMGVSAPADATNPSATTRTQHAIGGAGDCRHGLY